MFQPKLVIFDMDGLMFDTERIGGKCHRQAAKEMGYTIPIELSQRLIGGNKERNTRLLKEVLGQDYPANEVAKLSKQYREAYFDEHGLDIKPGLIELIKTLKHKNIFMAVASSSSREVIDHYLKLSSLEGCFDYIISGDKIKKSKPEPDIFLHACDHFHIDPQETLVLEDSRNGVLAGHHGHIPVICVPDTIYHDRDIFELTEAMVPSLHEVTSLIQGISIDLALFDMDGLMFDTERMCIEPLIQAHHEYGYKMTHELCYQLIGTAGVIAQEILSLDFGEDYPFKQVMQRSEELLLERIEQEGLPIKKGLVELLDHLKACHIPCVIASSSKVETIKHYLEVSKLDHYFNDIIGGDLVEKAKPEPDLFLKACDIMQVKPSKALVFEDSKNGILAAKEAKIPVVCVPDLLMHDQEVLNNTLAFIPDLSHIIRYIEEEKV